MEECWSFIIPKSGRSQRRQGRPRTKKLWSTLKILWHCPHQERSNLLLHHHDSEVVLKNRRQSRLPPYLQRRHNFTYRFRSAECGLVLVVPRVLVTITSLYTFICYILYVWTFDTHCFVLYVFICLFYLCLSFCAEIPARALLCFRGGACIGSLIFYNIHPFIFFCSKISANFRVWPSGIFRFRGKGSDTEVARFLRPKDCSERAKLTRLGHVFYEYCPT